MQTVKHTGYILTISFLIVLLGMLHFFPTAQAAPLKYNILAVVYSEGCETMLNHHLNTTCPTLDKIWKYDTSNKAVSGKLIIDHGKFVRTIPQVKNHYMWYINMTVCVDCELDLFSYSTIKTIFIEPSSFTYITKDQVIKNSHNFYSYSNRYVSSDCSTSTIGYSDSLLQDTISYMLSNCTHTSYSGNQTNTIKDTPIDYKNAPAYKYQNWLDKIKQTTHTGNCITKKCDTPVNPFKNKNWG